MAGCGFGYPHFVQCEMPHSVHRCFVGTCALAICLQYDSRKCAQNVKPPCEVILPKTVSIPLASPMFCTYGKGMKKT